ncbi:uncharacterized protein LOC121848538 isoform X2 [Callorhinchus milii]|uniref:uncharacterized protein LOC121848538 isoform X2 n=1 Tax=Callorhinchus milii TaxID=7868 RepID=UPI001C3FEFAF|nr:uncharacterized protein LOC121848538 isoform X2 [Callorhinchus milii]
MDYISLAENTLKLNEVILNLTYSIKLQVKKQRGKSAPALSTDDWSSPKEDERQKVEEIDGEDENGETEFAETDSSSRPIQLDNGEGRFKLNSLPVEDNLEKQPKHHQVKNFLQLEDKVLQESLQKCCSLLNQMNVSEAVLESETSEDSNSEVESEVTLYPKTMRKKKMQRCSKIKSALPAISIRQIGKEKAKQMNRIDLKTYAPFVNRYANRSNGGIPIFAEERLMERAANAKQTEEMKNAETVKQLNFPSVRKNEDSSQIPVINHAFFFHTGRKAHRGLKERSTENKREAESSQRRSNYKNTDAVLGLEDVLPGDSSKYNGIIPNNERWNTSDFYSCAQQTHMQKRML